MTKPQSQSEIYLGLVARTVTSVVCQHALCFLIYNSELSKTMSHDNSIACLTLFLNFAIFVPMLMNLWLPLAGAENQRSPHWSGHFIFIVQCFQYLVFFQGNVVAVTLRPLLHVASLSPGFSPLHFLLCIRGAVYS